MRKARTLQTEVRYSTFYVILQVLRCSFIFFVDCSIIDAEIFLVAHTHGMMSETELLQKRNTQEVGDMEFLQLLKNKWNFHGLIKNDMEFPGMINEKSCGISRVLGFRP